MAIASLLINGILLAGCERPKLQTIPIKINDKNCGNAVISIAAKDNKEGIEEGSIVFDFQPAEAAEGCCKKYGWIQHVKRADEWRFDNSAWHEGTASGAGIGAESKPDNATQPTEKDRPTSSHWKENPWYGAPTDSKIDKAEFAKNPQPQQKIGDNPGKHPKDEFKTQLICVDNGNVLLTWEWKAESPEKGKKIPPPK